MKAFVFVASSFYI